MANDIDDLDPLIHIRFGNSRSKYFEDALSTARGKATLEEAEFTEPESPGDGSYDFYTSDSGLAREVWEIVKGWQSSQMEISGEDVVPSSRADGEDLRRVEQKQRKKELVNQIDTNGSEPLVEIRFGPSSSKYADKAVQKAMHSDSQNEDTGYQKVTKGVYDNNKAEHLLVTKDASAAYSVYDVVSNWKNSEIRIDGQRATEGKLKKLAQGPVPLWVWIFVAVLFALSFLFGGT